MFELILKIIFLIVVLPFLVVNEGYEMLKKWMKKHNYTPDWAHTVLAILIVILIILLILQYGYH